MSGFFLVVRGNFSNELISLLLVVVFVDFKEISVAERVSSFDFCLEPDGLRGGCEA